MKCRGFSLLELLIVAVLFEVLATILLERLRYYGEAAEKANVEYTISSIRSALRYKISTLMVEGRMQERALLAHQNPMDWLDVKPTNYVGAFIGVASAKLPPGNWCFDTEKRELVYLPRNAARLQPDALGRRWVRLRGVASGDAVEIQVDKFRWL